MKIEDIPDQADKSALSDMINPMKGLKTFGKMGKNTDESKIYSMDLLAIKSINHLKDFEDLKKRLLAEQINMCLSFSKTNLPTIMVHRQEYE